MQQLDSIRMARGLKALCDPNRLAILAILVTGEYCVSDLVDRLGLDQPKVSHHLAILRSAGVIRSRRDGRHINYSLKPDVHRRAETPTGLLDTFDLGEVSISFRFEPAVRPAPGTERIDARSAGAE